MRFSDRYSNAYKYGFPETLFDGSLASEIELQRILHEVSCDGIMGGYCSQRTDENGMQLAPFAQEYELLDLLSNESPPRNVFVVGEAGCGKSTFLRLVFGFLRHYWEDMRTLGVDRWIANARNCLPPASPSRWVVLEATLEESSDPEVSAQLVCRSLRRQLLSIYEGLLKENEWAMIRDDRQMRSHPDTEQAEHLKQQADSLQIDDDKASEFCRLAFHYLRRSREPSSERMPLVLLIDDSDFIDAEHVRDVILRLEKLVADSKDNLSETSFSYVYAVRPDTYDRRLDYHKGLPSDHVIELCNANYQLVVDYCSKHFVSLVTDDLDDLEDEISPDEKATYSIPIPSLRVPGIAKGICKAASGGFDENKRSKHVATTIIAPLCGSSLRRIKRFQRRIASSIAIENRVRTNEATSNYDVLIGLITGASGMSEALGDAKGVGEWFPKSPDPMETYLHAAFVLGSLVSCGNGNYSNKLLASNASMLMLGDVDNTILKLAQFGYIGRPRVDSSFRYQLTSLKALLNLVSQPAYVDITAVRILGTPEKKRRGRYRIQASDAEQTFANSLRFLHLIREHESNWITGLQAKCKVSPTDQNNISRCLNSLSIPILGEWIRSNYVDRLRAISENRGYSYNLRDIAAQQTKEYLKLGAIQHDAVWSVGDLSLKHTV